MTQTRCTHCNKTVKDVNDKKMCDECDIQFKEVMSKVTRKYAGALKGLAQR